MTDPTVLTLLGVGALTAKKSVDVAAELLTALVKPTFVATGELVASPIVHINQRRTARVAKALDVAVDMLGDVAVDVRPIPDHLLEPIVQGASLNEDEGLNEAWAALLANSAADGSRVLPSYPAILAQLSSVEAHLLAAVAAPPTARICVKLKDSGGAMFCSEEDSAAPPLVFDPDDYQVYGANLQRLGLCFYISLEATAIVPTSVQGRPPTQFLLQPTPLGRAFLKACTRPEASAPTRVPA